MEFSLQNCGRNPDKRSRAVAWLQGRVPPAPKLTSKGSRELSRFKKRELRRSTGRFIQRCFLSKSAILQISGDIYSQIKANFADISGLRLLNFQQRLCSWTLP